MADRIRVEEGRGWNRAERWGLVALAAFTVLALVGFATFGRNPALLARFPGVAGFYGPAFAVFAQGHIVVGFAALAGALILRVRWAWILPFVTVSAIALGAELLGTTTGFPFGRYEYTELLGPRVAGRVPVLIPVSWFLMALPAYALARRAGKGPVWTVWLGAFLLTIWDLTLDPAMSELSPYWIWETPGPFYGMPIQNLAGWMATGACIMVGLRWTGASTIADRVPLRFFAAFYGLVLSLSVGMTVVAGFWGAVVATAVPLAAYAGWLASSRPRSRHGSPITRLGVGGAG